MQESSETLLRPRQEDSRFLHPDDDEDKKPPMTTPPRTAIRQRQDHNPPLSVVVVRETPPSVSASVARSVSSVGSSEPFRGIPIAGSPTGSMPPPSSICSGGSFRLQPRGRPGSSPFSAVSRRGRKRNVQCLSATSASTTVVSKDVLPASEESSVSVADSPRTQDLEQPAVELSMKSLSIKSPRVHRAPVDFNAAPSMRPRVQPRSVMGSSFITYGSSPVGCQNYLRPRGDSIGSAGSSKILSSPPSSTKSSPRYAPLTVLQNVVGSSEIPAKRPPLHCGRPSSLMVSLDGCNHKDGSSKDATPGTPIVPLALIACSPPVSTTSSNMDYTPGRPKRNPNYPSTPERTPIMSSPTAGRASMHMSPATPASQSIRSAHDTALPNIKLTPRETPRSDGSNRDGSMITSPLAARDLGLLPIGMDFPSSRSETSGKNPSERTVSGKGQSQHFHLQMPPPAGPRPSYLSIPEWCNDAPISLSRSPFQSYCLPPREPSRPGPRHAFKTYGEEIPEVKTRSILGPHAHGGGFLEHLIREQECAAAMDADGSLSDPDEEEPFVLTDPALIAQDRQSSGPARQRQRVAYNSFDQATACTSSMSLTSAHASNTSLLGVDLVRGDSTASVSRKNLGNNFRKFSFEIDTPLEEPCGPSLGLDRSQSDESLDSIGLALETAADPFKNDGGRDDLVTPPAMEDSALYSPPLSGDYQEKNPNCHQARSVHISSANAASVNETISMMAYQSGHNHKLSPQMECPS